VPEATCNYLDPNHCSWQASWPSNSWANMLQGAKIPVGLFNFCFLGLSLRSCSRWDGILCMCSFCNIIFFRKGKKERRRSSLGRGRISIGRPSEQNASAVEKGFNLVYFLLWNIFSGSNMQFSNLFKTQISLWYYIIYASI